MFSDEICKLADLAEEKLAIRLDSCQIGQFSRYGELLLAWNQRLNLTRITDPREIIVKHFLDSLVLVREDLGGSLCDVGTGAGFPGLPVKIALPSLAVTLVDSLAKRIAFLEELSEVLALQGVKCVHARAEDFGRVSSSRGSFDSVTSRAVAAVPILLEFCLPLLRVGGRFYILKGRGTAEEIRECTQALCLLGGEIERVVEWNLGPLAEHRSVIVVHKVKETPEVYPRRAGVPEKKPLR